MKDESPIQMLDEAVHLLRRAPASAISAHLAGSVPFLVAFLFFWSDMSYSRAGESRCAAEAFGVALLFVWMVCWKAVFAGRLRRELAGAAEPRWTLRRAFRLFAVQGSVQAAKLVVLPAALVAMVPAASATAFFRNVTALADDDAPPEDILRNARRQTAWARRQNWFALGLLFVFAVVVFLNVTVTLAAAPMLLRMLTGWETVFSRGGASFVLNTTFFAVAAGVTWLCVDPLVQAFYVLRCFVGQSVTSGEDIRADLRKLPVTAALLLLFCGAVQGASPALTEPELDRSLDEVLARREYQWRLPRVEAARPPNAFIAFTDRFITQMTDAVRWLGRNIDRVMRWLRELFGVKSRPGNDKGAAPAGALRLTVAVLAFLAACASVVLYLRFRARAKVRVRGERAPAAVDLAGDDLLATQLPEDEWLAMAQDSIGRGEYRLALRALFLASLAHLARHRLVTIHRSKSNGEYEAELRRRSRAVPEIPSRFREHRGSFERGWYGRDEVTPEQLDAFRAALDRIRTCTAGSSA